MNASAEPMQRRGAMIKRLNEGILTALKRIRLRPVAATLLGGCAGLSLTSSVLPTAMTTVGLLDSFTSRWELGGYAVYSVMVWAVGGWAVQKTGSPKAGALILGLVGVSSGTLLTAFALGTDARFLATGGLAGLLYGVIGGMILASALRNPPDETGG